MRFNQTALYSSIICSCCRSRRVDQHLGNGNIKGRENTEEEDTCNDDNFIDNPLDEQEQTFKELIEGYIHGGEYLVEALTEKIDMGPRKCSYSKKTDARGNPEKTSFLGRNISRKKTANGRSSYTPLSVEMRGITLRQLWAIKANVVERCKKEGWVSHEGKALTLETVTLYDINTYIVKPFTKESQASFVETLPSTCGTQPPHWFASHWWGEPFVHTLACLERLVLDFSINMNDSDNDRGGGMTIDTPIWICIFANNQWRLEDAITIDPRDSSFSSALATAKYRVISILDAEGNVFSRVWCDFELHLTFSARNEEYDTDNLWDWITAKMKKNENGIWVVYTSHKHKCRVPHSNYKREDREAVGIISGGAPGELAVNTSVRESHFPIQLILKSRDIQIQTAQASQESDRIHILNCIAGMKDLKADPPLTHPNYDKVNDAVKSAFAASMPALKAGLAAGGEEWKDTLIRLSKGLRTEPFYLNFDSFLRYRHFGLFGHRRLSSSKALELVSHIPITCNGLFIQCAHGEDGEGAIEGMIEWIRKAKKIKYLDCYWCTVGNVEGGRELGSRLAATLEESHHSASIQWLRISRTDLIVSGNVLNWAAALKNMTALKWFVLEDVDISDEEWSTLRKATNVSIIRSLK